MLILACSELSSDEDSDVEQAPTSAEKQAAQDKLIPSLPKEEWGSHTQKPQTAQDQKVEATPPISAPKLEEEHYDGASDDEDDDEEMNEDQSALRTGEEGAQIMGDGEVDMDQEMEEFLRFTREALGLTAEQYDDILKSRSQRGGEFFSAAPGRSSYLLR